MDGRFVVANESALSLSGRISLRKYTIRQEECLTRYSVMVRSQAQIIGDSILRASQGTGTKIGWANNFVATWIDGTDCEGVGWWYDDRDSIDP